MFGCLHRMLMATTSTRENETVNLRRTTLASVAIQGRLWSSTIATKDSSLNRGLQSKIVWAKPESFPPDSTYSLQPEVQRVLNIGLERA